MNGPCKVIIETPDGKILESTAYMVSVTQQQELIEGFDYGGARNYIPGMSTIDIELKVVSLQWTDLVDWKRSVHERSSTHEWRCSYCHRPNQRRDEICKSCGAVRSFVYG